MPTSDYQNLAVNVDVTAKATAYLQPLWGCEIKHGGAVYRMWLPSHGAAESFSGEMPQDAKRKKLAEKLKNAGGALFGIGALLCCGVMALIDFSGNGPDDQVFLFGMSRGATAVFGGLIIAIPFVIMGFKKQNAGKADLDKTLKESKTRRQNNKPRV